MSDICGNCDAQVSERAKFCNNCGSPLSNSTETLKPDSDFEETGKPPETVEKIAAAWYYEDKKTRQGPFDEEQMAEKINAGVVRRGTLVWKSGMAEWQEAVSTNLSACFEDIPPDIEKSPFGGSARVAGAITGNGGNADSRFAWGIVGVNVAAVILTNLINWALVFLCAIASAFLARKDVEKIAAYNGAEPDKKELLHGTLWGFFLPPVYLWKRATKIGDKKRFQFWVYIAINVAIFVVSVAIFMFVGFFSINDTLIVSAINEIIVDNSLGNARCESVTRTQKLSDTNFIYKAFMDNGRAFDVEVTRRRDGNILVEIPTAGLFQIQGYFIR